MDDVSSDTLETHTMICEHTRRGKTFVFGSQLDSTHNFIMNTHLFD